MSRISAESFHKLIHAHDPALTPEKKLWRAVLQRTYEAAEIPLGPEADDQLFIYQDLARGLLRADDSFEEEWLKLICDFAEVPADRVISWARQRYPRAA